MEITPEEFTGKFNQTVDTVLVAMAEHADINPEKFYSMACILENLAFFSPVIYSVLRDAKNLPDKTNSENFQQE